MSVILSIETSTKVCSVALHHEHNLIGLQETHLEKTHSANINMLIESILKISGISFPELDAIAISKGPGSYTGLRIGTSTAKGLCYGLNIPLIAIDTLASMAYQVSQLVHVEKAIFCPMIDARRMEVYFGLFDIKNNSIKSIVAEIIHQNSFDEYLPQNQIFYFGDGAVKCKSLFQEKEQIVYLDNIYPSAKYIGGLAFIKYQKKEFENLSGFEPCYLKEFVINKQNCK